MKLSVSDVLQYVEENDVKFVKLTFCDLFGRQRNVSAVSQQLPTIFGKGHMFDSSAVRGFTNVGDLLLFPDPKTLTVLPWRPQSGEVVSLLSYVKRPDGSFFEGDAIHMLDVAKAKAEAYGISCEIGTESDFYVFKSDNDGNPTKIPADNGEYFDCSPFDACENLRRDIILSLEDMGIVPTSSHHEKGPGQNEIEFVPAEAADSARNFLHFKSAVSNVCDLSGLHADFAPKPLPGSIGNGLRITITVSGAEEGKLDSFMEGVLGKVGEFMAFLNSMPESYELLGEYRSPAYGAEANRASYIASIPMGDGKRRIEINAADCLINPFLVFALILEAGADGIAKGLKPKGEKRFITWDVLPNTLGEALDAASKSKWLRSIMSDSIVDEYVRIKRKEIRGDGKKA